MTSPVAQFLTGLLGGVEVGAEFRGRRDDRRQAQAEHGDDRAYEMARRLREGVAFDLNRQNLQGQIDARSQPQYTEVSPGATLHDPSGRRPDYTAPGGQAERTLVTDWQREGFKSQEDWQAYHKQISRAGAGPRDDTPKRRQEYIGSLMKPQRNQYAGQSAPNGGQEPDFLPGVSIEEANRLADQIFGPDPNAPRPVVAQHPAGGPSPYMRRPGPGTAGQAPLGDAKATFDALSRQYGGDLRKVRAEMERMGYQFED